MDTGAIRALTFDVFGTVVDWRSSLIREGETLGRKKGLSVDWPAFADAWRGLYQPNLTKVRNGEMPWTKLDDLHRMALDRLIIDFKIAGSAKRRSTTSTAPGTASTPGRTRCRGSRVSSESSCWPRSPTATWR